MQRESLKNNWLCDYRRNVSSQNGEDGVIEKVFSVISETNAWCVEFGAGSGKKGNNTWALITNKRWSAALIEAERALFNDLVQEYCDRDDVVCINSSVGYAGKNTLDNILKKTPIPRAFDFLSIDIDGYYYQVWEALADYRPRVVMIEINPNIPLDVDFVQPASVRACGGSSLSALVRLGKKKGYELIFAHATNAIFVQEELYPLFGIENNDPIHILCGQPTNKPNPDYTFFQMYDGSIVLLGVGRNKILAYRKKLKDAPVWVFENGTLYPISFTRDNVIVRRMKNALKKSGLYAACYGAVKQVYGRLDEKRRSKTRDA